MKKLFMSLMFCLMVFMTVAPAFADHPYSPGRHLRTQHTANTSEYFCADVKEAPNTTLDFAATRLKEVLYNETSGWDELANRKLYFVYRSGNCRDLASTTLASTYVRYEIDADTNYECGGSSCIDVRGGTTYSHTNATDWTYGTLVIRETTFKGTIYSYIINHETAHAIGLIDGDGTCDGSIMHSKDYGCSGYPAWPSAGDRSTITSETNELTY